MTRRSRRRASRNLSPVEKRQAKLFHRAKRKQQAFEAWERTEMVPVFEEIKASEVMRFDDETGQFYLHKNEDGELRTYIDSNGDEQPLASGRASWTDPISGSLLFALADRPVLPLARYAWWYHYNWDCGGENFEETGGCMLVERGWIRDVSKDNLVLCFEHIALMEQMDAEANIALWTGHLRSSRRSIISQVKLTTAVRFCKENNYDDPVRSFLEENPNVDLYKVIMAIPHEGDLLWWNNGESAALSKSGIHPSRVRKKTPLFVNLRNVLLPAENVMWYMVTETFAGEIGFRTEYRSNLRIQNLMLRQPDYLEYVNGNSRTNAKRAKQQDRQHRAS